MATLNIGKDFSPDPSGRFKTDGDSSGEKFREDFFKQKVTDLNYKETLTIILDDGVEGYGSSFLVEGFAGMVKYGYITKDKLLEKIKFAYTDNDFEFYEERIKDYIKQAFYDSKTYPEKS